MEAEAVAALADRVGEPFLQACRLLLECRGRVVVTGMGKSGMIARKIAATLASTGTPALFLHPAEGVHGDLGMVAAGDVVLALSYSGESDEVVAILPILKRLGIRLIALTGSLEIDSRASTARWCSMSRCRERPARTIWRPRARRPPRSHSETLSRSPSCGPAVSLRSSSRSFTRRGRSAAASCCGSET